MEHQQEDMQEPLGPPTPPVMPVNSELPPPVIVAAGLFLIYAGCCQPIVLFFLFSGISGTLSSSSLASSIVLLISACIMEFLAWWYFTLNRRLNRLEVRARRHAVIGLWAIFVGSLAPACYFAMMNAEVTRQSSDTPPPTAADISAAFWGVMIACTVLNAILYGIPLYCLSLPDVKEVFGETPR